MSIFTSITYFKTDYYDLNKFIQEKYGLSSFEGHLESSNDTTHEFNVTSKLDQWHEEDITQILHHRFCEVWKLGVVLDDMCAKGWIEPGKYLIRVSW